MDFVQTEKPIEIKSLSEVLTYQNEDIVYRFMDFFDLDLEASMDIFEETKKWLWLRAINKQRGLNSGKEVTPLFIDGSLLIIDEMWHTFILYTIEYRNFCQENFGFFIDHTPTSKAAKHDYYKRVELDPEGLKKEQEEKLKYQYSFIYDHLGEETLVKWYGEFPEKYSLEIIKGLKKG
ncbi:MAG: hypothetical protein AB8H03_00670 [Saprospiraceae bacterium]